MTELLARMAEARDLVLPEPSDVDQQWRRLSARRRRRRSGRAMAMAALVLLATIALGGLSQGWFEQGGAHSATNAAASSDTPELDTSQLNTSQLNTLLDAADLRFRDGSAVYFLDEGTDVMAEVVTPSLVRLSLSDGRARFVVTPGMDREFTVQVGDAEVTVVGTRFVLSRKSRANMRVDVEEGRVRVRHWIDGRMGETFLNAGESLDASTVRVELEHRSLEGRSLEERSLEERSLEGRSLAGVRIPPTVEEPPVRTRREPRPAPREAVSTWTALAEEGRFDEAYTALLVEGVDNEDVGDLLLAADAARLSGHREQAVAFLREVQLHPEDPRASLGAFTLGRVLLRVRPHESAEAFARARRLDPESSLAEDALAREVEAWYLAGRPERAQELAREYVRRWPDGLRVESVRRLGRLEPEAGGPDPAGAAPEPR